MDHPVVPGDASRITSLGGKSWTAYAGLAILSVVLLFLVTPLIWQLSATAGLIVLAASAAFLYYQYRLLRSYHLYFDDVGVWVYSGLLPWKRGVAGVKWRDLDEAVFTTSLGSWLFKSYAIRIGHRFTKSSEILLSHWAHGREVVAAINRRHQELIREDALR